ncbi:methyltransferase domain-containing protein [Oharaeibacter diazotrophicus]|uniref:Methyltransferase family protein n=1 Tax=Oharaeibacter diazotrophicus TaxID=1920512 RepID=A0A4R6R8Y6_9HYPH|nr:class I SAM-dependent methyltransferase [Oharaeibacter diazotrophicus]TDP82429.1 methyltransferase family protein [Oharaeibacter diazotrophicus]BBE72808.1 hypothetical protein OHA_1_02407 [Pleomorphomonas sp. SM30]GLS76846.1 SAM-dependent methyltransferase [Oharaeibacter diazotrophicus]
MNPWDQRYDRADYLFGTRPNAFLERCAPLLRPGATALAVADGEGRNGVWLAERGLAVRSVDGSAVAVAKACRLAAARGVALAAEVADLDGWDWPIGTCDVVVAIFVQFAAPPLRARMFAAMRAALAPGGLLLLEGYRPEQIAYGTGGPSAVENLYTADLLRAAFADFEILELAAYDAVLEEGTGHAGPSALIDLVARRR